MWADGQTIKKPISCSAPRYVDYLLTWVPATPPNATLHRTYRRSAPHTPLPAPLPTPLPAPRRAAQVQNLLDDERIFPTEIGRPFPSDFMEHIRNIFKASPPPTFTLPPALCAGIDRRAGLRHVHPFRFQEGLIRREPLLHELHL